MNCVVIGGGGFIGQWLTRRLLDSGRSVVVLGRRPAAPQGLDARARYVGGDYGDPALASSLLAAADEVVDLAYATVPKSSFDDPVFDLNMNLQPAVNLLQAAVNKPHIRKLVLVSSGGTVYGHAVTTPIAETHPTDPVSPYGITKLAIEKYGLMFHRLYGVPVVVVRPGNAYGEGQAPFRGQGFVATAIASMLEGRPLTVFGGDEVIRDYVHVDDIAAAIVAALDVGEAGTCYNAGSGLGHSTQEVLDLIEGHARHQGVETEVIPMPARPFDVKVNVLDCTRLQLASGWRAHIALADGVKRAWDCLSPVKCAADQGAPHASPSSTRGIDH